MVLSPDRGRFVFLPVQGAQTPVHIGGTRLGSAPREIPRTRDFAALGADAVVVDRP
ncbi:hypothetical protein ACQEU3_35225 [Spirillospora sp. CA-253888]